MLSPFHLEVSASLQKIYSSKSNATNSKSHLSSSKRNFISFSWKTKCTPRAAPPRLIAFAIKFNLYSDSAYFMFFADNLVLQTWVGNNVQCSRIYNWLFKSEGEVFTGKGESLKIYWLIYYILHDLTFSPKKVSLSAYKPVTVENIYSFF